MNVGFKAIASYLPRNCTWIMHWSQWKTMIHSLSNWACIRFTGFILGTLLSKQYLAPYINLYPIHDMITSPLHSISIFPEETPWLGNSIKSPVLDIYKTSNKRSPCMKPRILPSLSSTATWNFDLWFWALVISSVSSSTLTSGSGLEVSQFSSDEATSQVGCRCLKPWACHHMDSSWGRQQQHALNLWRNIWKAKY